MFLRSKPTSGRAKPCPAAPSGSACAPSTAKLTLSKNPSGFLRVTPSDIKGDNKTGMLLWRCPPQCLSVPLCFAQILWMEQELPLSWDIHHEKHQAALLSAALHIIAFGSSFFLGHLDTLWRSFVHSCLLSEGELQSSRKNETTPSSWIEGLGGNLT